MKFNRKMLLSVGLLMVICFSVAAVYAAAPDAPGCWIAMSCNDGVVILCDALCERIAFCGYSGDGIFCGCGPDAYIYGYVDCDGNIGSGGGA